MHEDEVDIAVPGNDDSIKAIKAFLWYFAEAGLMGIEDALVESGVDIGESEIDINTATKKVVQITKSSNKKATAISEIEDVVNVEFLKDSNDLSGVDNPIIGDKITLQKLINTFYNNLDNVSMFYSSFTIPEASIYYENNRIFGVNYNNMFENIEKYSK